jgi:hypothetical protein
MAGPNKLLMGIASLLGASLKRKREKADYLERLGLSQTYRQEEWDRQNEIREEDRLRSEEASIKEYDRRYAQGREDTLLDRALSRGIAQNTMLRSKGYAPGQLEEFYSDMQQDRKYEAGVSPLNLYKKVESQFDNMSQPDQVTLLNQKNWDPEGISSRSGKSKANRALENFKQIIIVGLQRDFGFSTDEATKLTTNLAPLLLQQHFGRGSTEEKLLGVSLMRDRNKETLMSGIPK